MSDISTIYYSSDNVFSNEEIDNSKLATAKKIIVELQNEMFDFIKKGSGPFLAAIYDENNNLVAKTPNSVVNSNCSNNHAEMNVIRATEEKFGTYDLSPFNLKLYVTAEPCIMCLGGIMWSGIKELYFSVPSKAVEEITGFDEGFKPDWLREFKQRGITVYGNIESKLGEDILKKYVSDGHKIYKPSK